MMMSNSKDWMRRLIPSLLVAEKLALSENKLEGTIPSEIGALTSMSENLPIHLMSL